MQPRAARTKDRCFFLCAAALLAACSSSVDGSGATGTGGSVAGQGGSSASGGSGSGGTTSSGGAVGTGGSPGSGGSSSSGGAVGTGGRAGTGGVSASGGSTSTGGEVATGGRVGTGGDARADAGPTGGSAVTGGTTGTGGTNSDGGTRATGGSTGGGGSATGGRTGAGGAGTGGARTGGSGAGGALGTGGTSAGGTTGFDPCPASGQCKIMPLGDSITDGTGFSGGYRVELFAKAIADKKNITFVGSLSNGPNTVSGVTFPKSHEGHFGWTIGQVDDLIPDPALNVAPHIVLLHLGTNDINQDIASAAPDRLGSLIDQIVTDLPAALVVVAKIIPEPSKASAISTYNAAIPGVVQPRASAGKHVILVDQFTGFPSSELGDGVHPNQAGYARMAGVWYEAIKSYLH
jgi:lysophospholipase L1-like esterase